MSTASTPDTPVSRAELAQTLSRLLAAMETPADLTELERNEVAIDAHVLLDRWEGQKDAPDPLQPVIDGAYTERNHLVALLARLFPSGLRPTAIEGWDKAWQNCVYIDLPSGQISYHFHDREAPLFEGLPTYDKPWDGHTKEVVHMRLKEVMHVIQPLDGFNSRSRDNPEE